MLQLEDYDWVTRGDAGATARAAWPRPRRGSAIRRSEQHYFAGFVLAAGGQGAVAAIAAAAEAGGSAGPAEVFVWALPQVLRDGFTWFDSGDG